MPIDISIPDDFIKDDERSKLEELFCCDEDHPFDTAISRVVLASLAEYKDMLLGMGLPSRADEIRQYRLFHLIKHYFRGRLPSETEVSSMFQLTQSRSRSLIRYVMTRFRYQLGEEIRNTLMRDLQQAEFNNDATEYRLVIQSDNVLEELNRIIATIAPDLEPIKKVRNMSRTFKVSEDSIDHLRRYFGIQL